MWQLSGGVPAGVAGAPVGLARRAVALAGLPFAGGAFGLGLLGAVLVPAGRKGFGELLRPGGLARVVAATPLQPSGVTGVSCSITAPSWAVIMVGIMSLAEHSSYGSFSEA